MLNAYRGTDRDRHFELVTPVLRPNALFEEARIAHHGGVKLERRHVTILYLLTSERTLRARKRDASGEIDDPQEVLTRWTGSGSSGIVSNPMMRSKVL